MPIYDKPELARRAKELSVVRDTFEKVLRLCEILRFISSSEWMKNRLALKGGTAINLKLPFFLIGHIVPPFEMSCPPLGATINILGHFLPHCQQKERNY